MKIINFILGIVSAIYYVVVIMPMSLLTKNAEGRKLFHFDKKPGGSYFYERNHTYTKSDFEGQ